MLQLLRKSSIVRMIMMSTLISFVSQFVTAGLSYASVGPTQPDMTGPSAINVDNWVDPFTGDFNYSIPLFDLGDIPITLNYNSGVTMEQEASWVGLGWSLNPGAITRNMRGLPDDFKGDDVKQKLNIRANQTYGVSVGLSLEALGLENLLEIGTSLNLTYNNYTGFGMETSMGTTINAGNTLKIGLNVTSQSNTSFGGVGIAPQLTLGSRINGAETPGLVIGVDYSTVEGLKSKTIGNPQVAQKTINFGNQTYTPRQEHDFFSEAITFNGKVGLTAFTLDGNLNLSGYFSEQHLEKDSKELTSDAYGYLYHANGIGGDLLMDFNREKDVAMDENSPNLPIGFLTHDLYSISAPNLSGTFRPYRNDIGYIEERKATVGSFSGSAGLEFAAGQLISPGLDLAVSPTTAVSETWTQENAADQYLHFVGETPANSKDENVYFAMMGEMATEPDQNFVNEIGSKDAKEFLVQNQGLMTTVLEPKFNNTQASISQSLTRNGRTQRSQYISYKTIEEKRNFISAKSIKMAGERHFISADAQPHHIAEITVTTEDGTRYIFGLPAYNTLQKEVTFNIGKTPSPATTSDNLVPYIDENSPENSNGIDHYYKEINIPPYAHSYLLTEIYSADYVDVTHYGPSADDFGNYLVYTYGTPDANSTYKPNVDIYKWRTPYEDISGKHANYWEGYKTNLLDDKANYVYGTKELWFLHHIETKDYHMAFTLDVRQDVLGASGEDGGQAATNTQSRLKSIALYSIPEIESGSLNDAIPIKTVHFDHQYLLCKQSPNSVGPDGAKLTLKKLNFTYNNSYREKYSGYEFGYSTVNPSYQRQSSDRWGNYKPDDNPDLPMRDHPYAEQNKALADNYAQAWNLTEIITPANGKIQITYESDDYAYVQNKEATQMFKIVSIQKDHPTFLTSSTSLYSDIPPEDSHNYLVFELSKTINAPNQIVADQIVKDLYVLGESLDKNDPDGVAQNLYFRVQLNVNKLPSASEDYEYVSGFASLDYTEADYAGAISSGSGNEYTHGYVRLKPVKVNKLNTPDLTNLDLGDYGLFTVNPISKRGWQMVMQDFRYEILNSPAPGENMEFEQVMDYLADAAFLTAIQDIFFNPNDQMLQKKIASKCNLDASFIRLLNPYGKKLGGGHRVKKVTIVDNWDLMTASAEDEFEYGKEYTYELEDGRSSGVAAYEPMIGADENPWKLPASYSHKENGYKYEKYLEHPFGESFFPAPVVGYSRVIEKNLTYTDVNRTATGQTEYGFYSAKDFPTKVAYTSLEPVISEPTSGILSFFKVSVTELYTGTQGYAIEVNDMHGKPKLVATYAEDRTTPLSKTEYLYHTDETGHVDNKVSVIDQTGYVNPVSQEMGVTYDTYCDFRKNSTNTIGGAMKFNVDGFLASIIPILVPTGWPSINYGYSATKTACFTKVISRTGILSSIIQTQDGSTVTQNNEVFDKYTGIPVVTSVQNEYEDRYYTVNYPAHWIYDGMGLSSENGGYFFSSPTLGSLINVASGKIIDNTLKNNLQPGDEVGIKYSYNYTIGSEYTNLYYTAYYWVYQETATNAKYLIDYSGNYQEPIVLNAIFEKVEGKVFRSGQRNLHSMAAGSVICKEYPINNSTNKLIVNASSEIISASASEFSDHWQTYPTPEPVITTECYCEPDITTEASDFFNVITSLIENDQFMNHMTSPSPAVFLLDNKNTPSDLIDDIYTNNFTTLLRDELGASGKNVEYITNRNSGLNHVQEVFLKYGNNYYCGSPTLPSLKLTYQKDGAEFNLGTSNPEAVALFNNELDYEVAFDVLGEEDDRCINISKFNITFTYNYNNLPQTLKATCSGFPCLQLRLCNEVSISEPYCIGQPNATGGPGTVVNPYSVGLLGVWKNKRNFMYKTDRSYVPSDPLSEKGFFGDYSSFWTYSTGTETWNKNTAQWQLTDETVIRDPYIDAAERKNALGIPSSTQFAYNHRLPEMVASNSRYKMAGFESFEDDVYLSDLGKVCNVEHFDIEPSTASSYTKARAHSGNYSLRLLSNTTESYTTNGIQQAGERTDYNVPPFKMEDVDCIRNFSPDPNSETTYLLTLWTSETGPPTTTGYNQLLVKYRIGTVGNFITVNPVKTAIIDGWQRNEYKLVINNPGMDPVKINFQNTGTSASVYIDDIRIQPEEALVKSYVYDSRTQRLMAELDENHFATFYEYDEDGKMVRLKKETEKGIMTLSEMRYHSFKK